MDREPVGTTLAEPIIGPLYTTHEVAKLLRVSQGTVQDWIRTGQLSAIRYGKVLRIREADLMAFGAVVGQPATPMTDTGEE